MRSTMRATAAVLTALGLVGGGGAPAFATGAEITDTGNVCTPLEEDPTVQFCVDEHTVSHSGTSASGIVHFTTNRRTTSALVFADGTTITGFSKYHSQFRVSRSGIESGHFRATDAEGSCVGTVQFHFIGDRVQFDRRRDSSGCQ